MQGLNINLSKSIAKFTFQQLLKIYHQRQVIFSGKNRAFEPQATHLLKYNESSVNNLITHFHRHVRCFKNINTFKTNI